MSPKTDTKKPAKKAKTKARSKRRGFAEDVVFATGGESQRFLPSSIRCDHTKNTSRWPAYPVPEELKDYLIGDKCCFTIEQIERRLLSLKSEGQITDIECSVSNTRHPSVTVGFLRLTAFLLAEARGELDQIPRAKGTSVTGIRARCITAPKDQNGWNSLARKNLAENNEREKMTAVDLAFYIRRQLKAQDNDGTPLTKEQVAADVGLKPTSLPRYAQLLSLAPDVLLAVHEGRTSMAAALRQSSKDGTGTSRGKQKGMSVAKMRTAVLCAETRPAPTAKLSAANVQLLIRTIAGETIKDAPAEVQAWAEWIAPDKDVKPAKPAKALADKPTKTMTKAPLKKVSKP